MCSDQLEPIFRPEYSKFIDYEAPLHVTSHLPEHVPNICLCKLASV